MRLSQLNKPQRFLTNTARLPLLTTPEKEQDVLEMTDAAASMDLPEVAKRTIGLFSEPMTSACYIFDVNFRDPEELTEAVTGEKQAGYGYFLLCNRPHGVGRQSELENTSDDMLGRMTWETSTTWLNRL